MLRLSLRVCVERYISGMGTHFGVGKEREKEEKKKKRKKKERGGKKKKKIVTGNKRTGYTLKNINRRDGSVKKALEGHSLTASAFFEIRIIGKKN